MEDTSLAVVVNSLRSGGRKFLPPLNQIGGKMKKLLLILICCSCCCVFTTVAWASDKTTADSQANVNLLNQPNYNFGSDGGRTQAPGIGLGFVYPPSLFVNATDLRNIIVKMTKFIYAHPCPYRWELERWAKAGSAEVVMATTNDKIGGSAKNANDQIAITLDICVNTNDSEQKAGIFAINKGQAVGKGTSDDSITTAVLAKLALDAMDRGHNIVEINARVVAEQVLSKAYGISFGGSYTKSNGSEAYSFPVVLGWGKGKVGKFALDGYQVDLYYKKAINFEEEAVRIRQYISSLIAQEKADEQENKVIARLEKDAIKKKLQLANYEFDQKLQQYASVLSAKPAEAIPAPSTQSKRQPLPPLPCPPNLIPQPAPRVTVPVPQSQQPQQQPQVQPTPEPKQEAAQPVPQPSPPPQASCKGCEKELAKEKVESEDLRNKLLTEAQMRAKAEEEAARKVARIEPCPVSLHFPIGEYLPTLDATNWKNGEKQVTWLLMVKDEVAKQGLVLLEIGGCDERLAIEQMKKPNSKYVKALKELVTPNEAYAAYHPSAVDDDSLNPLLGERRAKMSVVFLARVADRMGVLDKLAPVLKSIKKASSGKQGWPAVAIDPPNKENRYSTIVVVIGGPEAAK